MLYPTDMPFHVWRTKVRYFPFHERDVVLTSTKLNSLNYMWITQDRKHLALPAPTYIDYVMSSIQNLLDDENTFPTKSSTLFA